MTQSPTTEVAEWLNDPFINNVVPPYANGEGTGCDVIMETGDQLVGNSVPVTLNGYAYHPQTQDMLQFFTGETPSSALGGLYIFPNDPNVPNAPAPRVSLTGGWTAVRYRFDLSTVLLSK